MGEPVCYVNFLDEFGRIPEPGDVNIVLLADRDFVPAGCRVLIDRVWPAGVSGVDLRLDLWIPQVAPSAQLDSWFGGDSSRWPEFVRRYRAELDSDRSRAHLELLEQKLSESPVVLLYSAADRENNAAVVLRQVLSERAANRPRIAR